MSLAYQGTRRRRLHLHCSVGRHCTGGLRMCRGLRERGRQWYWGKCVMQGEMGSGGNKGGEGSGGSEPRLRRDVLRDFVSFTSFASSIFFTSLLLSAVLLLSGCTRSVQTEPGVVNFLIESMPVNLDPRIGTDDKSEKIDGLIFSGLIELDAQRNPHGDLAEKWERPGPLTYVFHLRAGVKFHDGRALTSADVKYTFDSIANGTVTSPKRGAFTLIQSIETPNPLTVIFHLKEPYGQFLWSINRSAIGIVPFGAGADFSKQLIGTGPFRFVSADQDSNVVLERNDAYFGALPKISRVQFRVVPEAV